MALNPRHRHVATAGIIAFIAWRFATSWLPVLRYTGYAFAAGGLAITLSLGGLVLLSARKPQDLHRPLPALPRVAAFVHPKAWETDTAWLSNRSTYERIDLYPSSIIISNSLDKLLDWLLRDLVTSWYSNISRSPNFVREIDSAIRTAALGIRRRIFNIDIVEAAISRIAPLITNHLKDFYDAERAIRGRDLKRNVTESEELDLAIARKYRDGKLHPAASLAYSDMKLVQQEYLRKIVGRLLSDLLPESMIRSRAVAVFIREIVSCAVLAPLMQMLSDPDTWNQLMEAYGRTVLQDRKTVRKLRAALDQHASPAPKLPKPRSFPRLTSNDDERKFERFVRAIRQCNNLSEARRIRSEVASQLKRESMMDGQDQIYLRRLETGKYLLDQRVGKLSAVGGTSNSRVRQPDFRSGQVTSRMRDASISDILHDASGLSYFMEFMDRQRLMNIVQFWIVVDGFRNPLEDDILADDNFSASRPLWTEADRADIAQIYEAYLSTSELMVSEESRDVVRSFLKAGQNATMSQYRQARRVVLMAQSAVLELMQEKYYPSFKKSDLYYKYLTSDDTSARLAGKVSTKSVKTPSVESIPESPSNLPQIPRAPSRLNGSGFELQRNAASANDLKSSLKAFETPHSLTRRSLDVNTSAPLFDDDIDNDLLSGSVHSIDNESLNGELGDGNQEQMVEAMEAALNDIMISDLKDDEPGNPLFESVESNMLFSKDLDSPRSSGDGLRVESIASEKERRPNLASLGLVNTSSRIGVFTDNDLFDDEEKFIEDEHADPEGFSDEKELDDEIHEAAPGDLGLAEAISALTFDIERLASQESVVDTLTRKAELTNNLAELRILGKSKSSLQREIRRKELQRQQYIVQESDNSLYGRANVDIKSIMVGKEDDGQEFALYVIEVQRKAGEHMSAASWAVARRYSEFHDLHSRLRSLYPAVRHLNFPRRRLVMKLQRDFLHKRRVSLEAYLRKLLQLPAVCSSRDLRAFLSQQAIISTTDTGRDGERRDIVSRIYNSVTDGMDEFLGNLPVLDQLSLAGQNLISAATSQLNTMPSSSTGGGPTSSEDDSTFLNTAEARAELLAFENREIEPFVKPICDLFLETFELNRANNWLRGRAVVVVLHQLLGGTVERKVRDAAHALVAEQTLLKYLDLLKETMWPGGGPLRRDVVVRTDQQKAHSRREANVMLATLVPDLAGNVVGRANAQAASRRILATVNNPRLNTHFAFTVLDELVGILFPRERGER